MMKMIICFLHIYVYCSVAIEINLYEDITFFLKALINYPEAPSIVRVRNPDEVKTDLNNVTTLDFIGLVERYGYTAEEHHVTTEDGYNLVIHRISGSPLFNGQQKRSVVFFQHGLTATADCWVLAGGHSAGKDLAFLLADQGYDLWFGNVRGNAYCRSHVKLSPRNRHFWQFSYHEISTRDLPVMIDYVLSYTRQKTLHFVCHSMGTTALLMLLSMKPEYNAKIKLGILLAPSAMWNETLPLMEYSCYTIMPKIKEFLDVNEIYELFPLSSRSIVIGRTLCADKTITQALCAAMIFLMFGYDPAQLNSTALPEMLSQHPSGTSVQTIHHVCQNIITKKFQAYDYGFFGNYKQYGQKTPIMYDFQKITAPLAMFYGANDLLAPKSNVLELCRHLPNVILLEEIPYKLFNHLDFLWAIDRKVLLYDRLMEILQKFERHQ